MPADMANLMSRSGMVEIPHLQAKRRCVMPAKAGIHLRTRCKAKENLDSRPGSGPEQALRRIDEKEESTSRQRIQNPSALSRGSFSLINGADLLKVEKKHRQNGDIEKN